MTNTEEIIKLKRRIRKLENKNLLPWMERLAEEYIVPGIDAAVGEKARSLEFLASETAKKLKHLISNLKRVSLTGAG